MIFLSKSLNIEIYTVVYRLVKMDKKKDNIDQMLERNKALLAESRRHINEFESILTENQQRIDSARYLVDHAIEVLQWNEYKRDPGINLTKLYLGLDEIASWPQSADISDAIENTRNQLDRIREYRKTL